MPESFLILLAGGILFAAAVSSPSQVTLNWLRLCGILALAMAGLAGFFLARRDGGADTATWVLIGAVALAILAQLAFAQVAWRTTQRLFASIAFVLAVIAGARLIAPAKLIAIYAASAGIAAMTGSALMDMLLGHAYLTASKMTIAPFRRLNLVVAGVLVFRAICAAFATFTMPREVWMRDGLFILTRWLVGLIVPAVFIYMAHDCIKRRSTQSATGILYVAGVLIFVGELIALYLVRGTGGLPF